MTDGFGSVTWWGFSPCLDLLDADINKSLKELKLAKLHEEEMNILLVGAGDCRHLLKTLSQRYRHPKRQLNFYIAESSMELYGRNLLFLSIALASPKLLGIQEKTELFLELYGNILVRQQSMDYVQKMATEFIKMITDFGYLSHHFPIIDMSLLKFKERDMLEGIFKFWRNTDNGVFEVDKYWDLRLRKYLGVRYDAIPNVFDWDFHMKLAEKGAGIINSQYYAKWRQRGIAFEVREGTYDVPNKTLASGLLFKVEGESVARRGYWGDILVSPYISFGIESDNQQLFKKANNTYIKCSEHVSEYNLNAMLYEILHEEKYTAPTEPEKTTDTRQTATLTEITEEEEDTEVESNESHQTSDTSNPSNQPYEAIQLDGVKIFYLPLMSVAELHKKSRFHKLFHLAYFSNSMVHLLTADVCSTLADQASVILETAKFMLELKTEQYHEFAKKIIGIAENVGCKVLGPVNEEDDNFVKFTFKR